MKKKILCIMLGVMAIIQLGVTKVHADTSVSLGKNNIIQTSINARSVTGQEIVNEAKKHLGKPYVYGADGPNSFDCSGLTQYVYKQFGINITRTTFTQINQGKYVSRSELQVGDLVFPHTGHVGIYVGNNQMIHAPETGDVVKISTINQFYTARRILNDSASEESVNLENVIFDAHYYYEANIDLHGKIPNNYAALYDHWKKHGTQEGRPASPAFDVKFYLESNKDLIDAYGEKNYTAAYNHFTTYGYKESFRLTSPVFGIQHYKDSYPDLRGYSNEFLFNHFMTTGMNEGRTASKEFYPVTYKNRYSDLRNIYGDNMKMYYYHYLIFGRDEGRIGN